MLSFQHGSVPRLQLVNDSEVVAVLYQSSPSPCALLRLLVWFAYKAGLVVPHAQMMMSLLDLPDLLKVNILALKSCEVVSSSAETNSNM